jgi:tetratricopeptide (TPR) repeat protein
MKNEKNLFYIKLVVTLIVFYIAFSVHILVGSVLLTFYFLNMLYMSRGTMYTVKANRYYNEGKEEEAYKYYKKASTVKNVKPSIKITYAYMLIRGKKLEEAEVVLENINTKALQLRDEAQYKLTYALIKWKQHKLQEAVEMMEEVYNKYKYTTVYESLGYLLLLTGDYEKALTFNLEAYDYNNASNIIMDNLAESYFFLKDYDKAEDIYKKLLDKNPGFAEPYYYYGLVLNETGRKSEALEILEKALTYKEAFLSNLTKVQIQQSIDKIKPQ